MPISQAQALELTIYIEEHGGLHVALLDVSNESDWNSYVLMATFTSRRQGLGLLGQACGWLRDHGFEIKVSDQEPENTWFLCDAGDIVVHLFTQDARDYYNLESVWKNGHIIYPR